MRAGLHLRKECRLNALSGIGGVRTEAIRKEAIRRGGKVLMPCRALEAFGPGRRPQPAGGHNQRLNALSGIGGVRTPDSLLTNLLFSR